MARVAPSPIQRSLRDLVRRHASQFSPAERKVARALLAAYPVAGLESLVKFADRAGVSPPTVVRFVLKLGFSGYPAFQQALRDEVQEWVSSPLSRYHSFGDRRLPAARLSEGFDHLSTNLTSTLGGLHQAELESVARLLADPRRRIFAVGGRFSHILSSYLIDHLKFLRRGAHTLSANSTSLLAEAMELRERDVLVAFDFRRYQRDTFACVRTADRQGATVVVFTDQWLSPAAESARYVLTSVSHGLDPFDSYIGGVALVEILVASVAAQLGEKGRHRMEGLDRVFLPVVWSAESAQDVGNPQDLPQPGSRSRPSREL